MINKLRKEGRLQEAYALAVKEYSDNPSVSSRQSLFLVCLDMMKRPRGERNNTECAIFQTMLALYDELSPEEAGSIEQFMAQYRIVEMLAVRIFTSEIKGHKMTLVSLLSPTGDNATCEVHVLTSQQRMRYADIPQKLFRVLLHEAYKKDGSPCLRLEAAVLSTKSLAAVFPVETGYVAYIDKTHGHVHIYDSQSRHFVATSLPSAGATLTAASDSLIGKYVSFVPLIPADNNFKTAIIGGILPQTLGPMSFGLRKAKVTYVDREKGFCSWELLPESDGTVLPIAETLSEFQKKSLTPNTTAPAYTKGYLSQQLLQSYGNDIPAVGTKINIVVFLKRGRDAKKRPYVVYQHTENSR